MCNPPCPNTARVSAGRQIFAINERKDERVLLQKCDLGHLLKCGLGWVAEYKKFTGVSSPDTQGEFKVNRGYLRLVRDRFTLAREH